MIQDETWSFPAHLFPSSFTLLYCPYDGCPQETPFIDAAALLLHLSTVHCLQVDDAPAVIPFLDRYLSELITHPEEEDTERRNRLQEQRLKEILTLQEQERAGNHKRGRHCLFCNLHQDNKAALFTHMFQIHGFNIGQLDNLVMVEEFLDHLQGKLDRHICIYCEKAFPNGTILKKHIKNKNHYRIHHQNHQYDKYYVVNYLQPGRLYDEEAARTERDQEELQTDAEEEWADLLDPVDERTMCLFCSRIADDPDGCIAHMSMMHHFNWDVIKSLDTYDAIKVINYIRMRVADQACLYCPNLEEFDTEEDWINHIKTHLPLSLPERHLWDNPQFLFPVYEDDPLLCFLTE